MSGMNCKSQTPCSPVLCYVDGAFAYFTTRPLAEQWGDDWDDAPYEHNAETPYGPCWHNEPKHRNNPDAKRGWRPGTQTPYAAGEMCQCDSCKRDWNDDGTPKFEIVKVAWDGDFETPDYGHCNSPWSVEQINASAVAWLRTSRYSNGKPVVILAGTTLERFCELIREGGGAVYLSNAEGQPSAER